MKRIAVVVACNLHWVPFYYRYQQYFLENDCSFDLLMWNREGLKEETGGTLLSYNRHDNCNDGNPTKLFKFLSFSAFVRKCLSRTKYDRVFLLGTYAGVPALLSNFLATHYKGRYWIDIRDYSYEHVSPYYRRLAKSIKHSGKCTISSPGFKTFLPQHDYLIVHNIDSHIEDYISQCRRTESDVIRISYIGNFGAAFLPANQKLIMALKDDERFLLKYYGFGTDLLKDYCIKNGIRNVRFYGKYMPQEAIGFYGDTDIVNNLYGNEKTALKTALSNKLYFSAALNLPILVCPNTYMEEITTQHGFGFSVDFSESNWPDALYSWYIKQGKYIDCRDFWGKIRSEDMEFSKQLHAFLL